MGFVGATQIASITIWDVDSGATFKSGSTMNSCMAWNEGLHLCDGPHEG